VRPGLWNYAQLRDWYAYLNSHLSVGSDVILTDIDEAENRITYGTRDDSARDRLNRTLAALDIPCFLVTVEVTGAFTAQPDVRPMRQN
jgi:hypothetical protein